MILSGNGIMVTGTREGVTEDQFNAITKMLPALFTRYGKIFRHGDCIGVDSDVATIVESNHNDVEIFNHPPLNPKYRAYHLAGKILPEKAYLIRDHEMVDLSDFTIGVPKAMHEELRSGTWATIRYARKVKRNHIIVWPDGRSTLYDFYE